MLKYRTVILEVVRGVCISVCAILALTLGINVRSLGDEGNIQAKLQVNKDVGIAFDNIGQGFSGIYVTLARPDDWWIITNSESSKVIEKSGYTVWNRIQASDDMHIWAGYTSTVAAEYNNCWPGVLFHGLLKRPGPGGPGGQPPHFDASVGDIDIDVDSLGVHSGDHWTPSGSCAEDAAEATPSGGLYLPPSLVTGTLPSSLPTDSAYKILTLTLRPHWTGPASSDGNVGTLTFNVAAQGVALYKVSGGAKYTGSIRVPPGGFDHVQYAILTNENFTLSGSITATFQWDSNLKGGEDTARDYVRLAPLEPTEWKAWPGGQQDTTLNPTETFASTDFGFSGNVNWDVGQGGTLATITETGTTTATNLASITVRYSSQSATANSGDAVQIQALSGGSTKTKMRTVFKVTWAAPKVSGDLDGDNTRRFSDQSGTNTAKCEFNWDGKNGATWTAGKMEATLLFEPNGINWPARGVTFRYGVDGDDGKFSFKLERKIIETALAQFNGAGNRVVPKNDLSWQWDEHSHSGDTQYPTATKPNKAFSIDEPGFDADGFKQVTKRCDFWEIAYWHDGYAWSRISTTTNAYWHFNGTGVLPNCVENGTNNHNPGVPAENITNSKPVANAGANQTVNSQQQGVTLHGNATDADNDTWTYKWTQTQGPNVSLSDDTAKEPTFNAPIGRATLVFSLKISDITKGLNQHNPNTYESDAATVTITVKAP